MQRTPRYRTRSRTVTAAQNGGEEGATGGQEGGCRRARWPPQDGGAVQSSTGKSVGPPHRRPSPLLIPTAVLRLYLVPPSSSCPSSPFLAYLSLLVPSRPAWPLFLFLLFCLSRFSRPFSSLSRSVSVALSPSRSRQQ